MLKNPFKYTPRAYPLTETTEGNLPIQEIEKLWKNKIVPPHLHDIFYTAIAKYPELKNTHMIVVETKLYGIQHTLRSYPALLSLLNKKQNRVYPIVINTNKRIPNNFFKFSRDEQLGMLAHEFAHTTDYETRTSLGLLGLSYNLVTSKKFVRWLEHTTDETTILRGYGNELLEYRRKVLEIAPLRLRNFIESMYINPDGRETDTKKTISGVWYGVVSAASAIPAISQMVYLVSIRRMHTKPNWYTNNKKTLRNS